MNAPPGVDTDTSGEEFTPPPSPKAELPRPEFSLTSILPTQRLKKLRRANAEIKTQTPEQACESDSDPKSKRNHTRLAKKRVRIVDTTSEPDDTPVTPLSEHTTDKTVEQAIDQMPLNMENDRNPAQVIALLREMMAKNTLEDQGETGHEKTEGIDTITTATPDPADNLESSSPDEPQLPTPIGTTFTKRRPGGLDFSSLFRTKAKGKPSPSTANPSGVASRTDLSSSSGISSSLSQSNLPDPPKSAPSWLWTGPPTAGPPSQPNPSVSPAAQAPTTSDHPPWLWAGPPQGRGRGGQQPAAGHVDRDSTHPYTAQPPYAPQAHCALPPFPPYYPHPQSLQPWQPYYPPWTAPLQQYPGQNPYDGIAEASPSGSKAESLARGPSWQTPGPAADPVTSKRGGLPPGTGTEETQTKSEDPRLRPPAVLINRPKYMDTASYVESTVPERGGDEAKSSSSKDATSQALNRRDEGRVKKALRMVGIVPSHANRSKVEDDQRRVAGSSTASSNSSTWTECLLSLATCIHLGQKLVKHMQSEKGASSKHKGHFYRLLTKVLASLLTQRDVVEDMTALVGSEREDEISHFAKEIHTINKFFRSCLRRRTLSTSDTKRLSDLHGQASRSLEAGGLTHLFGQVFALTDYLTPVVINVVTGLLRDWAEDQLTAKSVMKALMSIQHEVAKVHQQQTAFGAVSKDAVGEVWTLLRYVDLLYGLFVSDSDVTSASPDEAIPGAWPSEPASSRKTSSRSKSVRNGETPTGSSPHASDDSHHHQVLDASRSKQKEPDSLPSPSHRSPRQFMSDFVHSKSSEHRDTKAKGRTVSPIPDHTKAKSSRYPTMVKQSTAKPTKDHTREAEPLPDIKVRPYKRSTPTDTSARPSAAFPSPKVRSTTPPAATVVSPQSSPSQYSQDEDDVSSEGTVSSDDDARSLLAQADSGPKRFAPLNIRKQTNGVEKQEVGRAKQLMSG